MKTRLRIQENRLETELWLAPTGAGEHIPVLTGRGNADHVSWSPSGRWLTYLSARNGPSQLYAWSPETRREVALTNAPRGVAWYTWSPDGARIAFTAPAPPSGALLQRNEQYGAYRVVGEATPGLQLLTLDIADALHSPQAGTVQADEYAVGGWLAPVGWSPDGQVLAFSGAPRHDPLGTPDIFLLDLVSGRTRVLVQQAGRDRDPLWSPDGKHVAFLSDMARPGLAGWHYELAVVPASGHVPPRSVSSTFGNLPRPVKWLQTGLYFEGQQGIARHLFRTDNDGRVTRQSAPAGLMAHGFSLSRDGSRIAFVAAASDSVDDVYVADAAPFTARSLTTLRESFVSADMGRRQLTSWKNRRDGETVEGVLITPRVLEAGKKYPLFVVVHGGPQEVDLPVQGGNRIYPVDLWVARGAIVLRPNYRGSGYSTRWRSLAYRGFLAQVEDVASGIAHLQAQGWVDRTRVACMGWSHGGYVVAMLSTSTTHCTAASVGAATGDWASTYFGASKEIADAYFGASPVLEPELYRRASIIPHLKGAQTPTLVQHGELDQNVPLSAGYSLWQMLADAGVKTEMIIYAGAGHNPGTPKRLLTATLHNLWWFGHHIFGDAAPDFVSPPAAVGRTTQP